MFSYAIVPGSNNKIIGFSSENIYISGVLIGNITDTSVKTDDSDKDSDEDSDDEKQNINVDNIGSMINLDLFGSVGSLSIGKAMVGNVDVTDIVNEAMKKKYKTKAKKY